MYSSKENIRLLISAMKTYGVTTVIHCPGGCSSAIGISLENDPDFTVYSCVDERSAPYVAIGIAQELNKPVAVLVTSGTATCNVGSGVAEAYYKGVPLLIVTADRPFHLLDQFEIQKIDQSGMFDNYCKYSCDLPDILNDEDSWHYERKLIEAMLWMTGDTPGPVQVNIASSASSHGGFLTRDLPEVRKVAVVRAESSQDEWAGLSDRLRSKRRVMLILGENSFDSKTKDSVSRFAETFGCLVSVEHMANYHGSNACLTYRVTESLSGAAFDSLMPDLVVTVGGHVCTVGLKAKLRAGHAAFEHWHVDPAGRVMDGFRSLSTVFACHAGYFFAKMVAQDGKSSSGNDYVAAWRRAEAKISLPDLPLSHLMVARELAARLPKCCHLDLAILNSTRVMQYFDMPEGVSIHSNIGALGIDGCLSTAIGRSMVVDELCVLLTGDLSFFYDMNALNIRYVGSNLRIVLLNNHGGGEFCLRATDTDKPEFREFIVTEHGASARAWAEDRGFAYRAVREASELGSALDALLNPTLPVPGLLEVFLDKFDDGELMQKLWDRNSQKSSAERMIDSVKRSVTKSGLLG